MMNGRVEISPYGALPGGGTARLYVLRLHSGVSVTLCDVGAALVGLVCPDRDGKMGDIVLGCDNAAAHYEQNAYFGAIVGRIAGRVSQAEIWIGDDRLPVARNHGRHQLHGGVHGLTRRLWDARIIKGPDPTVEFSLFDPAGSEGYPGNLDVVVRWTLAPPCRLALTIEARSDAPTPFNPTSHPYFNLDGHDAASLAAHRLAIAANRYTPTGPDLIPTGALAPVAGTRLDLRSASPLRPDIEEHILGFDHNFILDPRDPHVPSARLESGATGRRLDLWTDRPCLQLYTGGNLDGVAGKEGACYRALAGLCLEPQDYPDMFAHAAFPKTMLHPGDTYRSRTVYEFSTMGAEGERMPTPND